MYFLEGGAGRQYSITFLTQKYKVFPMTLKTSNIFGFFFPPLPWFHCAMAHKVVKAGMTFLTCANFKIPQHFFSYILHMNVIQNQPCHFQKERVSSVSLHIASQQVSFDYLFIQSIKLQEYRKYGFSRCRNQYSSNSIINYTVKT